VKTLLGGFEAVARHQGDGIRRVAKKVGQHTAFVAREVAQDEVRRWLATGWPPDADPDTGEVWRSDCRSDIADAIVAPMTATAFELQRVKINVELIVHNDESLNRNLVEAHQRRHGPTRKIHELIGFGQDELGAVTKAAAFSNSSIGFVILEAGRKFVCQVGQHHVAHIVAITGVTGPGVTEPDY
jgi:hypothetical protein